MQRAGVVLCGKTAEIITAVLAVGADGQMRLCAGGCASEQGALKENR